MFSDRAKAFSKQNELGNENHQKKINGIDRASVPFGRRPLIRFSARGRPKGRKRSPRIPFPMDMHLKNTRGVARRDSARVTYFLSFVDPIFWEVFVPYKRCQLYVFFFSPMNLLELARAWHHISSMMWNTIRLNSLFFIVNHFCILYCIH